MNNSSNIPKNWNPCKPCLLRLGEIELWKKKGKKILWHCRYKLYNNQVNLQLNRAGMTSCIEMQLVLVPTCDLRESKCWLAATTAICLLSILYKKKIHETSVKKLCEPNNHKVRFFWQPHLPLCQPAREIENKSFPLLLHTIHVAVFRWND